MKISEHFDAEEFVPEAIIDRFGMNARWFIDQRMVAFCEWLRDFTGEAVSVNNWHMGGNRDSCGFRVPDDPDGAKLSQHRFKGAIDVRVHNHTSEQVRQIIRDNFTMLREKFGITTIEKDTPTWCHVDNRWTGQDHIFEVPYK